MTNAEYGSTQNKTPYSAVHHNVWVVIADRTQGRILSMNGREFDVLKDFQADQNLNDGLAKDIASFLETAQATRDFAELVLVATPQMLGEIRKTLSSNILKRLVAQSDKNLMHVSGHQLRKELLSISPGPDQL